MELACLADDLIAPLGEKLTPELAKTIVELRAGERLNARILELGEKNNFGTITSEEKDEYEATYTIVKAITLLQIKARRLLKSTSE